MSDRRIQPVDGRRTARFDQPRPLGADTPTHIHGALDIAAPIGEPIVAPESGRVFAWVALRQASMVRWPKPVVIDGKPFAWANYFYDVYGGVLVVVGESGLTHIITHSWINQLFNRGPLADHRVTFHEPPDRSWPIGMATAPLHVKAGVQIGSVGNAGWSTGSHVHWEIHPEKQWANHEDRINPEEWLEA